MLGLPDAARALLFDLDGVLTQTAVIHQRAWKQMFDEFLAGRGESPFREQDYLDYVDGKPRPDGVRGFLSSRGITLPEGGPDDPPNAETVYSLGARKNALVVRLIDEQGVDAYEDAVRYLDALAATDLKLAVVSSSANCRHVLEVAGLLDRFELIVDGVVGARESLPGKPAPDTFLYAAKQLGAAADDAVVFEDALAGVQAGRAGNFCAVVGVNRGDEANGAALEAGGASVVVGALTELLEIT